MGDGTATNGWHHRSRQRRAVIADEWAVLRSGVAAVLAQCGVEVVGQVATVDDLVQVCSQLEPDLVLVGALPPGPAVTADADGRVGGAALVVLLPTTTRGAVIEALDDGAVAVLARTASETELREAVMRVVRGERYLAPGLLADAFGGGEQVRPLDTLTDRERMVLVQLAEGRSNRQIADALYIGEATVKTHLHNIYTKLSVANRVQAVGRARELRLLEAG